MMESVKCVPLLIVVLMFPNMAVSMGVWLAVVIYQNICYSQLFHLDFTVTICRLFA